MNLPVVKRSRFSNVPTPQATDRSKESSSNSSSSGSKSPDSPKKTPPKFNFSNISPVKKLQLAQKFGRERSNSVNSMKLPSLLERRNKESALYVETKDKRTSSASKQSADTSKTNGIKDLMKLSYRCR